MRRSSYEGGGSGAGGLRVRVLSHSGEVLLGLDGELDPATAHLLVATAQPFIDDGHRNLILDCEQLTFCDSSGLRALFVLWRELREGGSLTVVRPRPALLRLLRVSGMDDQLDVMDPGGAAG